LANILITISQVTNEGLMVLENDLCFADHVNRQYADQFALSGAKIGYTVNVRKPPRYIGTTGPALNVEDTNETYIPVTLTTQFHVDVQFTTADLATSVDLFKERIINPAVAAVANKIDRDGAVYAYQNIPNAVGTPGTPPASFLSFTLAGALLDAESAPRDGYRVALLESFSMAYAQDSVKGLFNPQAVISEQVEKGLVAKRFAGLDWYMDQNVVSYTVGAGGGSPQLINNTSSAWLASGWAANGLMQTNGWTASANPRLTIGDIITVTGVFSANPQNRGAYGSNRQRQFVVIAPQATLANGTYNSTTGVYSSTAGGALDFWVRNVGVYGGQFQNITAQPGATAAVQVWGSGPASFPSANTVSPQNIIMHRDCLALAFADLDLPGGVDMAARAVDEEAGINFRVVRQYTINNDALPCRFDVLYGWAGLYVELGVRLAG
jgi:P22 coat protein - gene protein 5